MSGPASQAAPVDATSAAAVRAGDEPAAPPTRGIGPEHVLRLREGHGANCSSIGSVIDTLFAAAAVGAAVFAGVVAALNTEDVTVAGPRAEPPEPARSGERSERDESGP